ncbi:MAG: SEC-C metal-binding domain-containing protein, partial [Bacillota bacterium]
MTNIFTNITDDEQVDRPVRSYKIGRNDPCPCGSGKKYKKCCARVNPDQPRDYYAEKIRETRDEDRVYQFLQQAVEDYPLEPDFILPLIVYHMQNQNMEQGLRYMRRAWRIMGSDLEDDFIFSFTSMLLEKGELEQAREVLETARREKRQSSTLLMARAEIKKALKQYQQALELLEQAEELNPEDTR